MPQWLAQRMARLGRIIVEAISHEFGRDEVLRLPGDPFWFQSFGAVMEWTGTHPVSQPASSARCVAGSSRCKTSWASQSVAVAANAPVAHRMNCLPWVSAPGWMVPGWHVHPGWSRRLTTMQDGYQLYLHGFVVADDGKWCVVQQGMATDVHYARRYLAFGERGQLR